MPNVNATPDKLRVQNIEIDENGEIMRRIPQLDTAGQLDNSLLRAIHPDIRVIAVQVPKTILDEYEEAVVTQKIGCVTVDGIEYRLIGASGSAKDGKFYAVEAKYDKLIAERFQSWPQAAITYFGILVSDCKVVIQEPDTDVLVVQEHALGTNDCRGWISERLFAKLHLPADRFYQFRLAFDRTQAKGSFKIMADDVADLLQADIVIPESSVKPKLELGFLDECQKWFSGLKNGIQGLRFRSPIALGIRDYSRDLRFKSSYTLTQHATRESLMQEIFPRAHKEVTSVIGAAINGDYSKLLEALGSSLAQSSPDDTESPEYTSLETSICEAVLKSDGSGMLVRHPYINNKLQLLLARWAFRLATGGGFYMPAFALADDGYLFASKGQAFAGSDWMPLNTAIASLTTERGLVIRYPIRMKEDLLPVEMLSTQQIGAHLDRSLRLSGCDLDPAHIEDLIGDQLRIAGTLVLHSKTAERNGGDYDFDLVAVLPESEFPRFVQSRFAMKEGYEAKKDKKTKIKTPWWNIAEVAMKARGNQIGQITNLISDCVAVSRIDFAYELAYELQNSLDGLKHNVQVDREVIRRIREQVPRAEWRSTKEAKRISDMPEWFEVPDSDIVGQLYNLVRRELGVLFQDVLPLRDFGGMVRGESFTREMHEDCKRVNRAYGEFHAQQRERAAQLQRIAQQAKAKLDAATESAKRSQEHFETLKASNASQDLIAAAVEVKRTERDCKWKAQRKYNQAQAKIRENEERSREEMRDFNRFLRAWGAGKTENRRGWCQALHSIAVASKHDKATGAIVFHAFPQEILDKLIEETGGQPVQLHLPDQPDGQIAFDESGDVFRIERIKLPDGQMQERRTFLFRISDHGKIAFDNDSRPRPVQPFAMKEGIGQIRNGILTLPQIVQRPAVRTAQTLRSPEDRRRFVAKCELEFGRAFAVYADGDPASVRVLDTPERKEVFIERAPVRPWHARAKTA